MKVLFVCRSNAGRSQVAQAYFSRASGHDCQSAGTHVEDREGETLLAAAIRSGFHLSLAAMAEEGFDISSRRRVQLSPAMVEWAELVVVLVNNDEVELPPYLENSGKTRHCMLLDPLGQPIETVRQVRDQIRELVVSLLQEIV